MSASTFVAAKARMRAQMKRVRRAQSSARLDASRKALAHLASLEEFQRASVVGLYAALGSELDPALLVDDPRSREKCFVWPRTLVDTRSLRFHRAKLADGEEVAGFPGAAADLLFAFVEGPYQILEPTGEPVEPEEIDLLVVPGLAFDTCGRRLGYGGGFYDEILSGFRGSAVGFGYAEQLVAEVPCEPHDQSVDIFVTPSGVLRFGHRGDPA